MRGNTTQSLYRGGKMSCPLTSKNSKGKKEAEVHFRKWIIKRKERKVYTQLVLLEWQELMGGVTYGTI